VQPYSTQRSGAHANCFWDGLSPRSRSAKVGYTLDLGSRRDVEHVEPCSASGNPSQG